MAEQEREAIRNSRLSATESVILDSEITDVLFQFDAIMDALEAETLETLETTPSPRETSPQPVLSRGSEPTSPCDVESAELVQLSSHNTTSRSNLPNVRELQKQFLLSRDNDATKTTQSKDVSQMRVHVQSIIQQLHIKGSSTSPEPPVGFHRPRRNSKSIQDKISVLTIGGQGENSEDARRAYTPPPVRRKIKSPFFRSKSEVFESILAEAVNQGASHPLAIAEGPSTTPSPIPNVEPSDVTMDTAPGPNYVRDSVVDQPPAADTVTELATSIVDTILEQVTRVEESKTEAAPVKDSPTSQDSSPQKPSDVPTPCKSPEKVFVTIREDYRPGRSSRRSKSSRAKKEDQVKEDKVEQKITLTDVEKPEKQSPVKEADRKRSAVIGLDDVELTFNQEPIIDEHPENLLNESSDSSSHVELIIGVRENGLFEAPPRIIDPVVNSNLVPPRRKITGHYDRLLSKTHYDHLPPSVESEDSEMESPTFRYRSASDVTSHRIHPVATPPPQNDLSSTVSLCNCVWFVI